MTQGNFARVMPLVLEYEGGFTRRRHYAGQATTNSGGT
jgi:hypothetical protein